MADKPPIEGTLIQQGREVKLMEGFAEIAERDLIQRLTPIEGEVIGPDERDVLWGNIVETIRITRGNDIEGEVIPKSLVPVHGDGTLDLYAIVQKAKRHPGSAEPIEGEVVTRADDDKRRADNAAMIVDIGLAVLATGDYIALPPVWGGVNAEKEVRSITPLQIEKKD